MMGLIARLRLNSIFAKLLLISLTIMAVTFLIFTLISSTLIHRDLVNREQGMEGAELQRTVLLLETAASEQWSDRTIRTALSLLVPPKRKSILIIDSSGGVMQIGQIPLPSSKIQSIIGEANISRTEKASDPID